VINNRGEKTFNFLEAEKIYHEIRVEEHLFAAGGDSGRPAFSMTLPPLGTTDINDMGKLLAFTIPDIIIKIKKMQGFNILCRPGINNTGIPSQEIVKKNHSPDFREKLKVEMGRQFNRLGLALDWSKLKFTISPEMQAVGSAIFVQLFREGNIYRKKHWFLRTGVIAKPAIEAVEKGDIKFIPEKWQKIVLNWLNHTGDWCISRPSRPGQQVPAYYCGSCGKLRVEEKKSLECDNCGSKEVSRNREVLAPWFILSLWPLFISGRDKHSRDFADFFPVSLMAAGINIILSLVARMIVMGIHCAKDIPFREVLITGIVRDEKGQKLSEPSQGLLNPSNIVGQYGVDTLRFALAARAVPGRDISFSITRIKGYKAFMTKIWNASRFTLMNLRGDEDFNIELTRITHADKWILHFLNKTVEKVNELMDLYRVNKAADLLYSFFRHEYCDWYLEFSKNDLENRHTRNVLKFVLFELIQLLHPFIPFITEAIYQKMKTGRDFLMQTEFPSLDSNFIFYDEFSNIELVKKVVRETRRIRTENRLRPNRRIHIYLKTESEKEKNILSKEMKYFDRLSGSARTKIVPDFGNLAKGFAGSCRNWEILIPLEDEKERLNELNRLRKELEEVAHRVGDYEKKLANSELERKTPQPETTNLKKSLQRSIDRKEKIKKTIADLS
jgi:valyl-tRNA synthetase